MPSTYEAKIYNVKEIDISGDELKDWEYQDGYMSDPDGIYIKNYTGNKKEIILPATIDGKKVRGIDSFAFGDSCKVTSIEVPGTYKEVGKDFGFNNETIEKVVIGEGIKSIGESFMFNAKKLKEVYVSRSVSSFDYDDDGFYYSNSALKGTPWYESQKGIIIIGSILIGVASTDTEVEVPRGVKTIACEAFDYSSNATKVILSDTVTKVEPRAFASSGIKTIKLTDALTNIGSGAFNDTSWFESLGDDEIILNQILLKGVCNNEILTVNNGIRVIGPEAFKENKNIKKVILPDSVTHICREAFASCKKLEAIEFSKSLELIDRGAFFECKKLTELHLPDSLKVISRGAFSQCSGLKTVNIPSSLTYIGQYAFHTCSKLQSLKGKSNNLEYIGTQAFTKCENLKNADFMASVKQTGYAVFEDCASIKTVKFSPNLKAISWCCFSNCSSLENVECDGFIDVMAESCFRGCSSLKSIKVAKKTIRGSFQNCTSLESIEFADDTTSIGCEVFSGCTALKNVTLPAQLETIESRAFCDCTAIEEITIPSSVKNIGDEAFAGCENLVKVNQPESYENFGVDVFTGTKYLKESFGEYVVINGLLQKYLGNDTQVTLPDEVTIIGENAFAESKQIETLIIPDSVREIQDTVFGGGIYDFDEESIPSLKELIIGNGVTKIGEKAFYCCKQLEKVSFGKSIETIGDEAFKDCELPELPDFKQLTSLKYIGKHAFSASSYGSYSYEKVELPPSVETVERSAFLGTKELVVYDTIDPNVEEAESWEFSQWNGTVNSPLACALISISDGYTECQGNANWRDYTITVKSAKDDSIKYRIFCDSDIELHQDEYRSLMFSAWGKNASFKFKEYDEFFKYVNLQASRMDMAFCRLTYPYNLSEEHKKQYEAFIIRCLYIERSARNIANYIGGLDSVDKLQFLDKYEIITDRNYDWIMEQFEEQEAKNCIDYLKANHADKK